MAARRLQYMPSLDGLRAVGIGLVLVTHAAKPAFLPGGYGVDVFFVLSGFLITTLLWYEMESTDRIDFGRFYLRRLIRLYPALLLVLAFTTVLGLVLLEDIRTFAVETIAAALYLSPLSDAVLGPATFHGHLWTLAAEEYFYLLWPILLTVFLRLRLRWRTIAAIMISGGLVLYLLRVVSAATIGSELALFRMGGIALGCGVAIIIAETAKRGSALVNTLAAVALLALAWVVSGRAVLDALNPLFAALATVAILFAVTSGHRTWLQRILETRPFVFVGKVSYELYLWHVPVLLGGAIIVGAERNAIWWWAYPIAFVLAIGTHFGLAPLQERWRRGWSPSRRPLPPELPSPAVPG